jgi:hypothetical protein
VKNVVYSAFHIPHDAGPVVTLNAKRRGDGWLIFWAIDPWVYKAIGPAVLGCAGFIKL